MKLNYDITSLCYVGSGIGVFEQEIGKIINKAPNMNLRGCLNFQRNIDKNALGNLPFQVKYSGIPYKIVYNVRCPFSYESMMGKADVNLFATYNLPLVKFKKPTIGTIHDLILLKTKTESDEVIQHHKSILKHTLEVSDSILTVSEASKLDIAQYFDVAPEKITVVHNGVDYNAYRKEYTSQQKEIIRKKYNLPDKYFLYFGSLRKHKNVERLIRAYALLSSETRKEYKLVITNANTEIKKLIELLNLQNDVVSTGFVDEQDKVLIYQLAFVSIFVSLYEGFGIPIIEAQAAGTPVITSNTSSMPEAAGGAALLVDPHEIEQISCAMQQYVQNSDLYARKREQGLLNAQTFSWDSAADKVLDVLKRYE